ncbi:MAG TPA: energy-coupling factor transporter ATPase [Candidatus Ligilactobacillus excrementigallinarum]|uniref:Energy-coupling factor transporter ATPase n=1 Tax=Candidatus Ligilactobacillus excrementigallinarum TaxID=2838641 RepID=A0A9D1UWZ6_9LACO|nr:energy-coupling factor transporter ATPase [Candidatus Ligilactobacillus excrementigallinarum]
MTAIIKVKDLSYAYDDFKLGPLNLTINQNEWISIIGKNGSGKSTFARLLDGLIEADTGEIIIDGLKLNEENIWKIRSMIGMVFQNPDNQFVGANVADDVAFGLENRQIPHAEMVQLVDNALKMVDMSAFKHHEPDKLSGGQKQRVAIAGVLAIHPKIVILDEATSMLDPEGRRELLNLIHQLKNQYHFTVIAITHDIDETVDADRILVMNNGQIIMDDNPSKIFTHDQQLLNLGLDLPLTEKIKKNLAEDGIQLSEDYLNEEEMAKKIWELSSKM